MIRWEVERSRDLAAKPLINSAQFGEGRRLGRAEASRRVTSIRGDRVARPSSSRKASGPDLRDQSHVTNARGRLFWQARSPRAARGTTEAEKQLEPLVDADELAGGHLPEETPDAALVDRSQMIDQSI